MKAFLEKLKTLYGNMRMSRASYKKDGVYPVHDWMVLLLCGIGVLLATASISLYFYIQIGAGKLFVKTVTDSRGEVNINSALFSKIVDGIKAREANLAKIKSGSLRISDPSL